MGICQVEKVVGGFQAEGMAGGPAVWLECGEEEGGPTATFLVKLRSRLHHSCRALGLERF